MKNVADLWTLMFGKNLHWQLLIAMIWSIWIVALLSAYDYPSSEWAGIALISYLALRFSDFVICWYQRYVLNRLGEYLQAVLEMWEIQHPGEKQESPQKSNLFRQVRTKLVVFCFGLQPIYVSMILTYFIAEILNFPSLPPTLAAGAIYGTIITLPPMIWFCGRAYFLAWKLERRLNAKTTKDHRNQLRLSPSEPTTTWLMRLSQTWGMIGRYVGNLDALLAAKPRNA